MAITLLKINSLTGIFSKISTTVPEQLQFILQFMGDSLQLIVYEWLHLLKINGTLIIEYF